MKRKKILSVMIVSVLVIGAFAVISGNTRAEDVGEPITEVDFGVTFEMSDGAAAAAEGDIHLFMHGVDGAVYQGLPSAFLANLDTWNVLGSYNNLLLNPAWEGNGTVPALDAVDEEWIEDTDDLRYLANNIDEEWTVNPFAHNDIRFAMQYLSRMEMVEDLLEGFGEPRIGPMARNLDMWWDYFYDPIEVDYGIEPEGDLERVEWLINHGMDEIAEHVADHPNMGEVTGNMDDGWYYNHPEQEEHQINIRIYARIEDMRLDLGEWIGETLEDYGFSTEIVEVDLAAALGPVFSGAPPFDDLEYHIYTGGWVSTTAVFYQEVAVNQMYMPWVGFMQTYGEESRWRYDQEYNNVLLGPTDTARDEFGLPDRPFDHIMEANAFGEDLYRGAFPDEETYFEMKVETARAGFEESVRVFTTTGLDFYPYNPERMIAAVPEAINGYDTYFGPRTMRTDDGTLETLIMTGEAQPYMDNWNLYGGSADVYGEYQRRLAREYGSWPNPQTGIPMQVGVYWESELSDEARTDPYERKGNVHTDYEWDGDDLIENIEIPETAVDYIPEEGAWLERDELIDGGYIADEMAAVEVTLDVHDDYVWHDGTATDDDPFTIIQDVMFNYARVKELGSPETEPYHERTGALNAAWWASIHAIEWDEDDGTYTVYGDYTFPLDPKVGDHYAMFPETQPMTYYGFDQLHATDDYHYDDGQPGDWIHQLAESHAEDMVAALRDVDEVPAMLNADANAPIPMDFEDWETRVDAVEDFVDNYGHAFIGAGPFIITNYDPADHDMTIVQFEDYGFPLPGEEVNGVTFELGYWAEQFIIEDVSLDSLSVTDVEQGQYIDVIADAHWETLFPEPGEEPLLDHIEDYRLRVTEELGVDEGEELILVDSDDIEATDFDDFTEFLAEVSSEDLDIGTYWMEFEVIQPGALAWERIGTEFEVLEPAPFFEVQITDYDDEVEEGDTVTIEFTIENTGTIEGTQDIELWIDGDTEETMEMTIEAGETEDGEFEWEAEEAGEYEITVASEDDTASVTVTVEEEEDPTPGFTLALLVLGAVVAVAIYYKKER